MNFRPLFAAFAAALFFSTPLLADRQHTLHVVTTGDVHGCFFPDPYVGTKTRPSLMSVKHYVDSLRNAVGPDNVMLLDAGDILQGDNCAYYFNYVKTDVPHLYSRMAAYMGYDAIAYGNHDIETGHPVYDKVAAELVSEGIPVLSGNILEQDSRKPYYPVYKMFRKAGLKVAVLGFDNPNMKAWLSEDLWKGLDFVSLLPYVQECVDKVVRKEKPQLVIVLVHSGTGDGDGQVLESQALDLFKSLKGVDILVGAHDHRPYTAAREDLVYLNGGARCGNVGHAVAELTTRCRKVTAKKLSGEIVRLDKNAIDPQMKALFDPEFRMVKEFTLQKVGRLEMPLVMRESYAGMCDYMNLLHTVQVSVPEADLSFAAPLTFNGRVNSGDVIFNDLFTIYPFENQLFVMKLKGSEVKSYLEYSYDTWIQTPGDHVLRIVSAPDPRNGTERYSFVNRSYNFDSAGGLNYTVDVTKPAGSRVAISSLSDGRAFDPDAWYNVAMTSYRANGGGNIIIKGAGIPKEEIDSRIVARYPEIREMVYQYFKAKGTLTHELVSDPSVIGSWQFVPVQTVAPLMQADLKLLFR